MQNELLQKDIELFNAMQKSPLKYIEKVWGLYPQPPKPEFKETVFRLLEENKFDEITAEMFGDYNSSLKIWKWYEFKKGKHITWQQSLLLYTVEAIITKKISKKKISVTSGHGTGKSTDFSFLIFWFLSCYKDSQVPCTAPTAPQMFDILWKEVSKWYQRMPEKLKEKFDVTTDYVRVTESPKTWFARARTASKDKPEALAGVHGDYVMMLVDEASGVDNAIFNIAEGALTNENYLVLLISNPTRLTGYFYDTHNSDKKNWITFRFNSEESPIVDADYVSRIIEKHGIDSDEYRIRVKGLFPKVEGLDDKGYSFLISENILNNAFSNKISNQFLNIKRLGIDPSGEGSDFTRWVLRDNFFCKLVASEKTSSSKSIAQKTLTLIKEYNISADEIFVDNFGVGANVAVELALLNIKVNPVNVGDTAEDKERYINLRAEAYWRLREWIYAGGLIEKNDSFKELLNIKYRAELSGKLKIMSKLEMKKNGIDSPDVADAFMLTFVKELKFEEKKPVNINRISPLQSVMTVDW
jgi:hypothetical protein